MKSGGCFRDCTVVSNTPHLLGVLLFIAVKQFSTVKRACAQHDQTKCQQHVSHVQIHSATVHVQKHAQHTAGSTLVTCFAAGIAAKGGISPQWQADDHHLHQGQECKGTRGFWLH